MTQRWFVIPIMVATAGAACAQGRPPVSVERTGALGRTPLSESSGVAVSRQQPGVLWTHNDSEDGPNLYAINQRGDLLATYRVWGARALDWEDLSLGPCPTRWRGRACLYIADTGDNVKVRARTVLYAVPEPDLPATGSPGQQTDSAMALWVRFTDGAHDIEALAVDPTGTAHLITKGRSGKILRYEVTGDAWSGDSVVAAPADTLPILPLPLVGRLVTGAAISPEGSRAAVRTLTEIYFFRTDSAAWRLDGPPCSVAGLEPQGEAVDFLDDERLILTSERGLAAEGVIHVIRCR